jgi:ribosomal protein RSM22 (predicted rRNA methylase)
MARSLFPLRGLSKELKSFYHAWNQAIIAAHEAKARETAARRLYDAAKDSVILAGVEGKNETERQAYIATRLVQELAALREAGDEANARNLQVTLAENTVAELRAQLRLAEVHSGIQQHGTALSR